MHKNFKILTACFVMFFAGACLSTLTATRQDWDYVMRTGGLRVEAPVKESVGKYRIPLTLHITEAQEINSGLCVRFDHIVADKSIQFWMITYLADGKHIPPALAISVEDIKPGTYEVSYRNRDGGLIPLGNVELR